MNDNLILFNQALDTVKKIIIKNIPKIESDIVLIRDLLGRFRVIIKVKKIKKAEIHNLSESLRKALGAYAPPGKIILFSNELFEGKQLFASEDKIKLDDVNGLQFWLLDRQLIGQEWHRKSLIRITDNRRITFYGIKGGVGRSTAMVIWALKLAKDGKNVLVFDLDLESPGVGRTLLPSELQPDYGIVDWFVEDAVGQAESIENDMITDSPLSNNLPGQIQVVPSYGRLTGDYLPKLSRCYMNLTGQDSQLWGERLQRMVETFETKMEPDVVFFDSRAGLHDIAAVLITRMDADTLLFAVDSEQTWKAYSFLFKNWKYRLDVSFFRERLQMVAGMVPETGREEHLRRFSERSWDLFRENIYDEVDTENPDVFSFDLGSDEAPHYPLPIFWNRALQEFDPCMNKSGIDVQIAEAALGKFMTRADQLVFVPGE